MPLQLSRQQQLLRESMRRERPYGPETACVAAEGKEETRYFGQSHCHDPEMNAEAEGGKLSSSIKTDDYTAWTYGRTVQVCVCVCTCACTCQH